MSEEDLIYIHSRCCGAHWEMVYNPNERKIAFICEQCGQSSGIIIPYELNQLCKKCGKKPL